MAYLLLIHEPRGQRAGRAADEARQRYDEMMAFSADLQARGLLKAAESLRTDEHAVRINRADGTLRLLDGPFAEAREMVGGFFLLDVADRDEALDIARRCPAVAWATVEVRECAPCHVP
ncbi:YciI family protein [Zoogloea sp.]|uniref:YciI family protein n=1 Tax=Zoogloea sp. TaxID=49181 RepID=UPI001416A336|nr:MAG: dehydrogenase [Zoogloea sp.]